MDWHTFLKLAHIAGTVLGVGGSTFVEIFYLKFSKNTKIDRLEHEALRVFYPIIRLGLIILVFSGFGYLILWRLHYLGPDVFYSARFLAKITIILVLLVVALLMNFRRINLNLGSAITLTSWYAAMILGIWRKLEASFIMIIFWYFIGIVLVYLLLRFLAKKQFF